MAKELYSFDELKEMLDERGLEHFLLPGTNNMLRLGDEDTTIHRARDGFILYATRKDYDAITQYYWPDDRCTLHSTKGAGKEGCEQIISVERMKGDNQVICLEDGNAVMNAGAPKCQPDRIYLYTNENMDFILDILQEQRQSSTTDKRFDTNDSVWIAAAAMSYEIYHKKQNAGETIRVPDFSLVQSDIRNRTLEINGHKAEGARTSQWCCGDHPNHNYCFLRELADKSRRLSFPGEFGGKEEPENLKMDEVIKTSVGNVTIQQLFDFVHTEYAALSNQVIKKTSIDYKAPLDYLDAHAREAYAGPDKQVSVEERARIDAPKESAQNAVEQINKMMALCEKRFKLKKAAQVKWLDGSNVKTKHYLWGQMKYSDQMDSPITISIFVDLHAETKKARYRISLEIMNKDSDKALMKQYHSYLDLDPDTEHGLVYGEGSNEADYVVILDENRDVVKAKVDDGTYDKVQYCRIVERDPTYTNDDYERLVMEGVQALIPYYEHVVGIKTVVWWPSKEEYDPGLTVEQWVEVLQDPEVTTEKNLRMFAMMLDYGKPAACSELAEKYGETKNFFNSGSSAMAKRVVDKTGCPPPPDRINDNARWWPVLYVGRDAEKGEKGSYIWKIRDELKEALLQIELPEVEEKAKMSENKKIGLNTILYGPPGTGKTYNTVKYAVSICDPELNVDEMEYEDILVKYNALKAEGRIAFTTFHQSYGYEEFIEGIKPVLVSDESAKDSTDIQYDVMPGVFKAFCRDAKKVTISAEGSDVERTNPKVWCLMLDGTGESELKTYCFENNEIRIGWPQLPERITYETPIETEATRSMLTNFQDDMGIGDIVVTQKVFDRIDAIGIVTGDYEYDSSTFDGDWPRKRSVKWMAKDIDESIYELNGSKHLGRFTIYELGRVKADDVIKLVNKNPQGEEIVVEQETKPYVFIIDEINRGNISKIFGELITLIEETKRAGSDEAMETTLPYSGESFSVPDNVYILGTMNTADRSIALMDTALRRRFDFVEMMPDSSVIAGVTVQEGKQTVNVAKMLDVINERIEFLYDREHTIGHAFFTPLLKDNSIEVLADIFRSKVIPLLQEYFYEDYAKIQLVLGDNEKSDDSYKFILDNEVKVKSVFKGNPEEIVDLPEKKYEIQDEAFDDIQSYIEIFS